MKTIAIFKQITSWLLRGAITGICVGFAISTFILSISWVSEIRKTHLWIVCLIPVAAIVTSILYRRIGHAVEEGTSLAIDVINESILNSVNPSTFNQPTPHKKVPLRLAPVVFFSAILSHIVGASAGKEGAGVQIGTSIAGGLYRVERALMQHLHRSGPVDEQNPPESSTLPLWLICGAGAAFSALFKAPIAGTLFGMQVASPRINRLEALAPCVAASFSATLVVAALKVGYFQFPHMESFHFNTEIVVHLIAACVFFGLISRLFCWSVLNTKRLFSLIPIETIRVAIVGLLLVMLSFVMFQILGYMPFNGLGFSLMGDAMAGETAWWIPVLKLLFTILTLATGLKGGEFIPLMVIGTTTGAALAGVVGIPVATMAMYGAVGVLSGATKLPIVCFMLGIELFGLVNPALFFLVCCIGYLASGHQSIYERQIL